MQNNKARSREAKRQQELQISNERKNYEDVWNTLTKQPYYTPLPEFALQVLENGYAQHWHRCKATKHVHTTCRSRQCRKNPECGAKWRHDQNVHVAQALEARANPLLQNMTRCVRRFLDRGCREYYHTRIARLEVFAFLEELLLPLFAALVLDYTGTCFCGCESFHPEFRHVAKNFGVVLNNCLCPISTISLPSDLSSWRRHCKKCALRVQLPLSHINSTTTFHFGNN